MNLLKVVEREGADSLILFVRVIPPNIKRIGFNRRHCEKLE